MYKMRCTCCVISPCLHCRLQAKGVTLADRRAAHTMLCMLTIPVNKALRSVCFKWAEYSPEEWAELTDAEV